MHFEIESMNAKKSLNKINREDERAKDAKENLPHRLLIKNCISMWLSPNNIIECTSISI